MNPALINKSKKLLAATPFLAGASDLSAAVIYVDAEQFEASQFQTVYLDFLNQTFATTSSGSYNFSLFGKSQMFSNIGARGGSPNRIAVTESGSTVALAFEPGDVIDSSLDYTTETFANTSTAWLANVPTYAGFSFEIESSTRYGWALYEIKATNSSSFDGQILLHAFAYEDNGDGITIAAVPEPSQTAALAGLFAGSAVALAARRRRKAAKGV